MAGVAILAGSLLVACSADEGDDLLGLGSTCSEYLDQGLRVRRVSAAFLSEDAEAANPGDISWGPEIDRRCMLDSDQTLEAAYNEPAAAVREDAEGECRTVQTAIESYRAANDHDPESLDVLVGEGLLEPNLPFTIRNGELLGSDGVAVTSCAGVTAILETAVTIETGAYPEAVAVDSDAVWVANHEDSTVARIDPVTNKVTATIETPAGPVGVAVGFNAVWVTNLADDTLARVDPATNTITATIDTGSDPVGVAVDADTVWVVEAGDNTVSRIDPATNSITATIDIGASPQAVAVGSGAVWVTSFDDGTVARVDPVTNAVTATIATGRNPVGVAVGGDAVWVANSEDSTVTRIDPATNNVTATIETLDRPAGVAAGGNAVWATNFESDTVARIDPATNAVTAIIDTGEGPLGVALGYDAVWVTNASDGTLSRVGLVTCPVTGSCPGDSEGHNGDDVGDDDSESSSATADSFLLNETEYECSKPIEGEWQEFTIDRPGVGEVSDRYFNPDDEEEFRKFCRSTFVIEYHAVVDILRRPDVDSVIHENPTTDAWVRALNAVYIQDVDYMNRILPNYADMNIHCVIVVHHPEGTRFFLEDGDAHTYVEVPDTDFLASLHRAPDEDVDAFWLGLH